MITLVFTKTWRLFHKISRRPLEEFPLLVNLWSAKEVKLLTR